MDTRLLILAFGTLAGATDGFVIGSLLPAIADDAGITVAQAGYIVFGHALGVAIGGPVLATVFGGRDRRLVLVGAAFVLGLGAIGIALSQGLGAAIAARVFLALGSVLYGTMAAATAVALSPPELRGRSLAIVVTGQSVAVALGAPLGAWVSVAYGWRPTHVGIGTLAITTAAMLLVMLPKGLIGETRTIMERLAVIRAPGLPRALLITFSFAIGGFMVAAYFLPITTDAMGLPASFQPIALFAYGVGAVVGNQVGGQLVDRIGTRRTRRIMIVAHVATLLVLPLVALLPGGWVAPLYILARGISGVAGWGFHTAQLSYLSVIAPASASLAISMNSTALSLGVAAGAIIGGIVLEQMGAADLGLVGGLIACVALILILLERPRAA
jgi:MFS transporter, DHA1 family, inner membrane transport protein